MLHIKIPVFSAHWDLFQSCVGAFWIHISVLYLAPEKKEGRVKRTAIRSSLKASMFCWWRATTCYCNSLCLLFILSVVFPHFHFPTLSTFLRLFLKHLPKASSSSIAWYPSYQASDAMAEREKSRESLHLPSSKPPADLQEEAFHGSLMSYSHAPARYINVIGDAHIRIYTRHSCTLWWCEKSQTLKRSCLKMFFPRTVVGGHVALASFLLTWNTLTEQLERQGVYLAHKSHHSVHYRRGSHSGGSLR